MKKQPQLLDWQLNYQPVLAPAQFKPIEPRVVLGGSTPGTAWHLWVLRCCRGTGLGSKGEIKPCTGAVCWGSTSGSGPRHLWQHLCPDVPCDFLPTGPKGVQRHSGAVTP